MLSRFLPLALFGLTAPLALAQNEYLFRPEASRDPHHFAVGLRMMNSVDVAFGNLGTVGFAARDTLYDGKVVFREYNDGFVGQDNTYADGAASDGNTSYFGFNSFGQTADANRTINYHQYASEASGDGAQADSGLQLGWELQYTRFLGRGQRVGLQFGFSFNNFTASENSQFTTTLLTQRDTYGVAGKEVPSPTEGSTGYSGPGTRFVPDPTTETNPASPVISLDPASSQTLAPIPDGAQVNGFWKLDSAFYLFRVGPVYDLPVGKRFHLQGGLGFNASYVAANYTASESITPLADENASPTSYFAVTDDYQWSVGFYADAKARYNLTERVDLFTGAEYVHGSDLSANHGDRTVEVDMAATFYWKTGIGVRF